MITRRFPAFKYRDFRLLWTSELLSSFGTNILTVAVAWHLYLLTDSALALGIVGLAQGIPFLLFNLIGGSYADVHNRKKILYITQTVMSLSSVFLAVATFNNFVSPTVIYIVLAIMSVALAFDMPARGGILPTLVDKKDLSSANSVYALLWQTSSMVGPALGGFLIAGMSLSWIYLIDGISTLAVLIAIFLIGANGQPTGEASKPSFSAIKEGFSFLFSKNVLWSTKLLDAVTMFFASTVIIMPIFADSILHVGPQGLGLLYSAPSVGGVVIGFLIAPYLSKIKHQGKLFLAAVAIFALATILFGLSTSFILSLAALFVAGGANVISVILRSTITQMNTPDKMMGRVSSISSVFWFAGDKLGDFEAGLLAQIVGAQVSVIIGGIGALVSVGAMTLFNRGLRNYTDKS